MKNLFFILAFLGFIFSCNSPSSPSQRHSVDEVELAGISVTPDENREFSYTDKASGYFYSTTHSDKNQMWFAGWNIAQKRILRDYSLWMDGELLSRKKANVTVFPDRLEREWPEGKEIFRMVDGQTLLVIELEGFENREMNLKLNAYDLNLPDTEAGKYGSEPLQWAYLEVFPLEEQQSPAEKVREAGEPQMKGFMIVFAKKKADLAKSRDAYRLKGRKWNQERNDRMETLLEEVWTTGNDYLKDEFKPDSLQMALGWIHLTLDQLIMDQSGKGIYAGLPWFNDYWGRDQFISLTGACLVSGKFETAKEILRAFAKYQQDDRDSPDFGRVPNRLRPDEVIYNSADATPRFISMVYETYQYTGDAEFVREMLPAIDHAIWGMEKYRLGEDNLVHHGPADTWMDAKHEGKTALSPRGDRAIDVQALWLRALIHDTRLSELEFPGKSNWQHLRKDLRKGFENAFFGGDHLLPPDHIRPDGQPDFTMRPNYFFALNESAPTGEIDAMKFAQQVRAGWESLVYPWGVASLTQQSEYFHPLHEDWDHYHKDAAYHNGTVWLWLNGIFMQRMIECEQPEIAWQLFKNMNREALDSGAVGSLPENMDAHPREGKTWAKRSGTFLQAWSNAEQLRVWYRYFLGFRPKMGNRMVGDEDRELVFAPRIPREVERVSHRLYFGDQFLTERRGIVDYSFERRGDTARHFLDMGISNLDIIVELPVASQKVKSGNAVNLEVLELPDKAVVTWWEKDGTLIREVELSPRPDAVQRKAAMDSVMRGVQFCTPELREGLECYEPGYSENYWRILADQTPAKP